MGTNRPLQVAVGATSDADPLGIPFLLLPVAQPLVAVSFLFFSESDAGPYPIPANAPVEGGPTSNGERRLSLVDLDQCKLYELSGAWPIDYGASWRADAGAIFDLTSNTLRPDGYRSADPSGLPLYPGLIRYDEAVEQAYIGHALRMTVTESQMAYIHPATDFASTYLDPNLPPMGLRLRLRSDYDCTSLSATPAVICTALQHFGAIVSAEGPAWTLTGAPDVRWDLDALGELSALSGGDFEAIYSGELLP